MVFETRSIKCPLTLVYTLYSFFRLNVTCSMFPSVRVSFGEQNFTKDGDDMNNKYLVLFSTHFFNPINI